jgi:hypothetical protein
VPGARGSQTVSDLNLSPEAAARLPDLMRAVGFATWQLQELENAVAAYVVIRLRETRGRGTACGIEISSTVEGRTLGNLLAEMKRKRVIPDDLATDLAMLLDDRNWLIHRARRETRGVLSDEIIFSRTMTRMDGIADKALALTKRLAYEVEELVSQAGVSAELLDLEAERLARSWGFE